MDLVLVGFDHMMDDDQDRGDEEIREGAEALEKEEGINWWRDNERQDTWWLVDEHVLWDARCDILSHAVIVNKDEMFANVPENALCEDVQFTHPVGYNPSPSTVNETQL